MTPLLCIWSRESAIINRTTATVGCRWRLSLKDPRSRSREPADGPSLVRQDSQRCLSTGDVISAFSSECVEVDMITCRDREGSRRINSNSSH